MRFYDTDKGEILVDGQPIKNVTRHSLRSTTVWCSRTPGSRAAPSVRTSGIGKPNATDEEIKEAAKRSHSWEFIRRLPDGLDTVLTEDSLSQGQKQLLWHHPASCSACRPC